MKKLQIPIFLYLLLGVNFCLAQSRNPNENPLVPRNLFFTGETRYVFKMDDPGKTLYFLNNKNPNAVFYCKTEEPGKIDSLSFPGSVRQFTPVNNSLLTIWSDSVYHLAWAGKEITLPGGTQSLKLLKAFDNEKTIPVEIVSKTDGNSGIYTLDIPELKLKKKHDLPFVATYFLDWNFNFVAGNNPNEQGGNALYYFKGNNWKLIESHPGDVDMLLGGFSQVVSVSEDGKTIYYTSNANIDKTQFFSFDIATATSHLLAKSELVDVLPFGASTDENGRVTSVVGLYAKTLRMVVDDGCKEDFAYLERHIEGDISFAQSLDHDHKWLIREFTGGPAKMYLFDRSTKKLTYLLSDYPALDGQPLAKRHAFTVKTRDGLTLPVHVYLPPGSDSNNDGIPDKPLPTVMYVHGGPWVGVVHWNQYFHWRNFQLLANRGYAVINCEFRGSTGLGKDFIEKSTTAWGTAMTNDKADIAQWAAEAGIAQKNKTGIWGWSYGGYAAMAGLAFHPETYACGVGMYGISDLLAFGKIPFTDNDFWRNRVGNPNDSAEAQMLYNYSPINFLDSISAPLLLTTGSKDERVPQVQSDNMAAALKKEGKEVVYFYYPDEVHDYRSPGSWISFWAITEQFLKEHLGGRAQPIGKDLDLGNFVVVEGEIKIKKWRERG